MSINYKLLELDDERFLTVYVAGEPPLLASPETHGNFDELVRLAAAGDESVIDLFDTGRAIEKAFNDIVVGRVAVRGGVVFYDDDAMDNAITNAILRVHEQGENLAPMVAFMDNVMANPQVESREQFYRFIEEYKFPIDVDGNIIAYKGVRGTDVEGVYTSLHAGHAFVNGKEYKADYIPQAVGDVVTMPRSEVDFDPNSACSSGLHAGTHNYAKTYANGGALMYVRINPRDVVSVPHDVSSQKVRVCRYEVVDFADTAQENEKAIWRVAQEDAVNDEEDYDFGDDEYDAYDDDDNWFGNEDEVEDDDTDVQAEQDETKHGFATNDVVKVAGFESWMASALRGEVGKVHSIVDYGARAYALVKFDNRQYAISLWLTDLTKVEDDDRGQTADSGKVDTRKNHLQQARDVFGHFIKSA